LQKLVFASFAVWWQIETASAKMSVKMATLVLRGSVLFIIGVIFALVLNLLQVQRQVTLFPDVLDNVFSSAWWVPPSCGTAAGTH
jgi:hypothetical protein